MKKTRGQGRETSPFLELPKLGTVQMWQGTVFLGTQTLGSTVNQVVQYSVQWEYIITIGIYGI